jgi:nicotinamide phosphoribosyltransferase
MKINPATSIDAYKIGHIHQFVPGMELAFGNMTPRKSYRQIAPDGVVWFGLQYFLKEYLIKQWNENFFNKPKEEVVQKFTRTINNYLGPNDVGNQHIADLHDLGYIPLSFWSLPEGVTVPYKVAPLVYFTTDNRFGWLQAYIETIMSTTVWPLATAATTAKQIRELLEKFAMETVGNTDFVKFQGHNFSYRGCVGHEAAVMIDAGFLTSFVGSDTVPGVDFMEEYYNANSDKELISCSVNASEHAVMASYGPENELEAFRRLIEDVYPRGIVSIVSDTRDYWNVIANFTVLLKDKILAREGKTVFRPDSGDNVKIIVGDPDAPEGSIENKGTVQVLWEIFGGAVNDKGFKELNPKVGTILGDGVNWDVLNKINEGLRDKGFASTNIVYGIGSYYLVYGVSRDTDGWAVKSTYCQVNGEGREIFKDPKTDMGNLKKSAKGLIAVYKDDNGKFYQKDQITWEEVKNCEFQEVFTDGCLIQDQTLAEIRERLNKVIS